MSRIQHTQRSFHLTAEDLLHPSTPPLIPSIPRPYPRLIQIHFTEFRASAAPPTTLGCLGDIYIDTRQCDLYGLAHNGWQKCTTDQTSASCIRVVHPHFPGTHLLWAGSLGFGWFRHDAIEIAELDAVQKVSSATAMTNEPEGPRRRSASISLKRVAEADADEVTTRKRQKSVTLDREVTSSSEVATPTPATTSTPTHLATLIQESHRLTNDLILEAQSLTSTNDALKSDVVRLHADIAASQHEIEGLREEKACLTEEGRKFQDRILELLGESCTYLGQIELLHEEALTFKASIKEMEVGRKTSLDRIEELEELVKASKESIGKLEGQAESWQGTAKKWECQAEVLQDQLEKLTNENHAKNVEIRTIGDERDEWMARAKERENEAVVLKGKVEELQDETQARNVEVRTLGEERDVWMSRAKVSESESEILKSRIEELQNKTRERDTEFEALEIECQKWKARTEKLEERLVVKEQAWEEERRSWGIEALGERPQGFDVSVSRLRDSLCWLVTQPIESLQHCVQGGDTVEDELFRRLLSTKSMCLAGLTFKFMVAGRSRRGDIVALAPQHGGSLNVSSADFFVMLGPGVWDSEQEVADQPGRKITEEEFIRLVWNRQEDFERQEQTRAQVGAGDNMVLDAQARPDASAREDDSNSSTGIEEQLNSLEDDAQIDLVGDTADVASGSPLDLDGDQTRAPSSEPESRPLQVESAMSAVPKKATSAPQAYPGETHQPQNDGDIVIGDNPGAVRASASTEIDVEGSLCQLVAEPIENLQASLQSEETLEDRLYQRLLSSRSDSLAGLTFGLVLDDSSRADIAVMVTRHGGSVEKISETTSFVVLGVEISNDKHPWTEQVKKLTEGEFFRLVWSRQADLDHQVAQVEPCMSQSVGYSEGVGPSDSGDVCIQVSSGSPLAVPVAACPSAVPGDHSLHDDVDIDNQENTPSLDSQPNNVASSRPCQGSTPTSSTISSSSGHPVNERPDGDIDKGGMTQRSGVTDIAEVRLKVEDDDQWPIAAMSGLRSWITNAHLDLVFYRTKTVMFCRFCLQRKPFREVRYPIKTTWDTLIRHCEDNHMSECDRMACLAPDQIEDIREELKNFKGTV